MVYTLQASTTWLLRSYFSRTRSEGHASSVVRLLCLAAVTGQWRCVDTDSPTEAPATDGISWAPDSVHCPWVAQRHYIYSFKMSHFQPHPAHLEQVMQCCFAFVLRRHWCLPDFTISALVRAALSAAAAKLKLGGTAYLQAFTANAIYWPAVR